MDITYGVEGMTCINCAIKIEKLSLRTEGVTSARISLADHELYLTTNGPMDVTKFNDKLIALGDYKIVTKDGGKYQGHQTLTTKLLTFKTIKTYKPILLIVTILLLVCCCVQYPWKNFSAMMMMRNFMAGFFITFSLFKLVDLKGFALAYQNYDIIAKAWKPWGMLYPFLELLLGMLYLMNVLPTFTNIATISLLSISSIGVIESNLNQKDIKCACLGNTFNLPMSAVTIIEDVSMVIMAITMFLFS